MAADRLRLTLGPGVAGLAAAQGHLNGFLHAAGCDARTLFRAELVVEEAVMNIMQHGDAAAHVTLTAQADSHRVELAIEDDRAAFNPLLVVSPNLPARLEEAEGGGVGLRLMRKYADRLSYVRTGAGRNRLEIRICRPAE